MADNFDVAAQTLPGGNVNQPASGTYGDVASLDKLKASFPQPPTTPNGSLPTKPMPQPQTGSIPTPQAGGLPPGLLAPTDLPHVPSSTPLQGPPVAPVLNAQTDRQKRLAIIDSLLQDPNTAEVTREWAGHVKDALIHGSAR